MIIQIFLDTALQLVNLGGKELFSNVEVLFCLPEEDPEDSVLFQFSIGLQPAQIWLFEFDSLAMI